MDIQGKYMHTLGTRPTLINSNVAVFLHGPSHFLDYELRIPVLTKDLRMHDTMLSLRCFSWIIHPVDECNFDAQQTCLLSLSG